MPKLPKMKNPVLPAELFVSKKIQQVTSLTTNIALGLTVRPPPEPNVSTDTSVFTAEFHSSSACAVGGPPEPSHQFEIAADFAPAVGVYIMPASTGAGKTVTSLALVAWANDCGINAAYISCFEPRSPSRMMVGNKRVFFDPSKFIRDLIDVTYGTPQNKLIICDSATVPMKAYPVPTTRTQTTFKGGMQPSDREFLKGCTDVAAAVSACIILPFNSALIPYVSDLAGGVEGIITTIDVANFNITDRTPSSGRRAKTVSIPLQYVNAALAVLKLGTYNKNKSGAARRGYSGI